MSNAAILVDRISKRYEMGGHLRRNDTIRDELSSGIRRIFGRDRARNGGQRVLWALKDVSVEIEQGEIVGIIGRNGAGKSTLLKILSRITEPTAGRAVIRGRIGSLLEVGTGFHPELTGRENIYLNGAILGMSREDIRRQFDEIVAFSGVERFLDTPVKRYSSGMQVRLAFAVAAHLDPDILLVDEVLAVGDAEFQRKCLGKMDDFVRGGRTVVFVSHNMAAIQQLTRSAMFLSGGRVVDYGPTSGVVARYLDSMGGGLTTFYDASRAVRPSQDLSRRVEFVSVELEGCGAPLLASGADIRLKIAVRGNGDCDDWWFGLTILHADGRPVGATLTPALSIRKGEAASFRLRLPDPRLAPGTYYFALATARGDEHGAYELFDVLDNALKFEMLSPHTHDGLPRRWFPNWGSIRFREPTVERAETADHGRTFGR